MKSIIQPLAFLILLCLATSCNHSRKENKTNTLAEKATFQLEDHKDELLPLIEQLMSYPDIIPLLNNAGASYIHDLTIPLSYSEKMMTKSQMSLFWGMYVFDMLYAKTYHRNDISQNISEIEYRLKNDLGLSEEIKQLELYNQRIANNKENEDSTKMLIEEATNFWINSMSEKHLDVLVYSFIGNNVEALHIASQLALLANNNTDLLAIINKHKQQIADLYSLIKLLSDDENIQPYYENLSYIGEKFNNSEFINDEALNDIASKIESVRNLMLNK